MINMTFQSWQYIYQNSDIEYDIDFLLKKMYNRGIHCTKLKLRHVKSILKKYELPDNAFKYIYFTVQSLYYIYAREQHVHNQCDIYTIKDLDKCKKDVWYKTDLNFSVDVPYRDCPVIVYDNQLLQGCNSHKELLEKSFPYVEVLSNNVRDMENILGIKNKPILFGDKIGDKIIIEKNNNVDWEKFFKQDVYEFDFIHNLIRRIQ